MQFKRITLIASLDCKKEQSDRIAFTAIRHRLSILERLEAVERENDVWIPRNLRVWAERDRKVKNQKMEEQAKKEEERAKKADAERMKRKDFGYRDYRQSWNHGRNQYRKN